MGHFAEFLLMLKRDSQTSRPDLIPSLDGLMPFVSSFQIDWNIDSIPAGLYLLKVNNRNTRTRCEICSKLTIKTPESQESQAIKDGVYNIYSNWINRVDISITVT